MHPCSGQLYRNELMASLASSYYSKPVTTVYIFKQGSALLHGYSPSGREHENGKLKDSRIQSGCKLNGWIRRVLLFELACEPWAHRKYKRLMSDCNAITQELDEVKVKL